MGTVQIAWRKRFDNSPVPPPGGGAPVEAVGSKIAQGNAYLIIPDEIVSYFNIPVLTETEAANVISRVKIAGFTYKRFADLTDTVGKDVVVSDYERAAGRGAFTFKKVVRLKHDTLKTSKGRPRTMSIRFPNFFNIPMIGQALGQMLTAKQPTVWTLDRGGSHPFIVNTLDSVPPGFESGAWVSTAKVLGENLDDTDAPNADVIVRPKSRKTTTP